ncbi:hypothetical protein N7481_011034 [Penicillium waksmanii]|uniref:uncharacterized protein n=1 Tax=Penicillium waksmanii TaxID=69791 RepID=UPI002547FAB2|nr:uncharacterized protein N7481_011034 [Penicillium waksmanii]KAJ5973824.1 hypothetical protein N7481_011034 [Penicillium waksmanii]
MLSPVVQFHGKWPFRRMLGMQEPFSVLFSFFNFAAHWHGMSRIQESIPAWHSLRKYYMAFGYFGLASWTFSMIFHTRDFAITEKFDYWGAGASVLYGLYLAVVRILRLDLENPPAPSDPASPVDRNLYSALHAASNVAVGIIQNLMWTGFSIVRYKKHLKSWTAWPGMIVAWLILAMSLELLDFPPWNGLIDAHSLWHLGTVVPTAWWYSFLIKDTQDDIASHRLKA